MLKRPSNKATADERTGGVTVLTHPKLPRQLVLRVGYVDNAFEGENDAWEKARLSALGRAGEKSDFFSILLRARSLGSRQGLLEDRAETEVREGIFEVGIQPFDSAHVRIGYVFHR
jgi:hypothetical protein